MSPAQIIEVQGSFAALSDDPDRVAALFYSRLFELDPDLRPLFTGDMESQGAKLMKMIGVAVGALGRIEAIVPAVKSLGERHHAYGVEDKDYATVGSALLWTLERGLGSRFTPATRAAWSAVYALLSSTMQSAARAAAEHELTAHLALD